jgi:diguanylate cyclase (GGDEF)-like protein
VRIKALTFTSGDPDQALTHSAFFVEQVSLLLVIQLGLVNLLSQALRPIHQFFPVSLLGMSVGSALAALFSAIALLLIESKSSRPQALGKAFGGITIVLAALPLCTPCVAWFEELRLLIRGDLMPRQSSEIAVTICLLLLGIGILLVHSRSSLSSHLADATSGCLAFLLLVLTSESLFSRARVPGASTAGLPPFVLLLCLGLLTLVLVIRRAQHGIFAVFLGNGIGGRVARLLAPIVILINLGREVGRARILATQLVPRRYAASVLSSVAILVGFVLLVLLCRLINGMQAEIENLTLRDELTGLYSYRGFNLFAEQAFGLSRRAQKSFGVLFVDMDNLKSINDGLGHPQGSACLVQIAKLLTTTFREIDLIGRLGGDEFVVAGQFEASEMANATERLRSNALESRIPDVKVSLSLSMGYAISQGYSDETLKSLLSRADKAMYQEKRAKKRTVAVALPPVSSSSNTGAGASFACAEGTARSR